MKIVFFGTPDFSVGPLKKLIENKYEICAVVTGADKQRGRNPEPVPTPVKLEALAHDIPVLHPKKMKDPEFLAQLKGYDADFFVVVAYGRILPKEILDIPKKGCINIHGSLLPSYRGAAPIQWAVIDGKKESGITTMMMDEGCDTGNILRQYKYELLPDETGGSLFDKLAAIGSDAIIDTLADFDSISPIAQGESDTDYARMLTKADGIIDWTRPAVEIERLIRGLNPWPSAYTTLDGKTLKIWKAEVVDDNHDNNPLIFRTGDGYLKATEVQLEGKKRMDADAFLRGYKRS